MPEHFLEWFLICLIVILIAIFVCLKKFNMRNNSGLLWPIATAFCILLPMLAIRIDVEFATPIKEYEDLQLQIPIEKMHILDKKFMLGIGKKDNILVYYYLESNGRKSISFMPAIGVTVLHDDSMTPGVYKQFNKSIVQGVFQYTVTKTNQTKIVVPQGTEIVQVPDI